MVWNPAPARFTLDEMLGDASSDRIAWLTPNESEATTLTGVQVVDLQTGLEAATTIHERFPSTGVVVTLGAQGAVAVDRDGNTHVTPPYEVDVVDTTAAGDAFTAAFAVSLANGDSVPDALSFAAAAGALTVTRFGAVPAIPRLEEVRALMDRGSAA